ncbi:MAG: HNH endonuclease [Thermoproteota archaeon]|nr:HNH endonuclease [Thermoproteota archaeon]
MSSLRKYLAFSGIILIILSSLLLTPPTQNQDQEKNTPYIQLFILWLIGIALIIIWILKERSDLLKISMVFVVLGQIMLWVLMKEPGNQNTYDSLTINQIVLIIIILWSISGLLVLIKKRIKHKYTERRGFPEYIKDEILQKQENKCAHCKIYLKAKEFDHKDGDRSNNNISN